MATTIISRKAQRKQATNSAPAPSPETIGTIAPIGSAVTDDGDPPSSRGRRRTKAVPTPDDVGDSHAIQASMPGALAQSSFYSHVSHTPTVVTGQLRSASWTPYQYTRSDTPVDPIIQFSSHSLPAGSISAPSLDSENRMEPSTPLSYIPQPGNTLTTTKHEKARSSRKATVEEVPDVDDPPQTKAHRKTLKEEGKTVSDIPRRRRRYSPSPVRDALPVNNDGASLQRSKQPGSIASAESRSQNYAWPGAQQLGPSALSPYPASVLNEYSGSRDEAVMSDGQRAMRRREKDRAVGSSPHKGGRESQKPASAPIVVYDDNSDDEIVTFTNNRGKRLAEAAIALDKEHKQMAFTEEARRRREQSVLGMNKLRDLRVNDDREFAEQVAVNDAVEEADFEYAKQVQAQDQEEFSRRVLEIQREAAEEDEKARVLEETARTAYEVACAQRQKAEQRKKSAVDQLATAVDQKKVRMDFAPPKPDVATPKPKAEENSLYGVGKPVPWNDRVVFQRLRRQMLKENGYSGYLDMNIGFDAKDEPIEIGPAPIQTPNWSGWDLNATSPAKKLKAEGQADAKAEGKSTPAVNPQVKKEKKAKKAEPSDGGGSSSDSSDSDSSSRASSRKKSKKNRRSYRSDSNYSRSETTDSAFGDSSESERDSRKKRKKRRKRDSSPSDSSGDSSSSSDESSDESSSSDEDKKKKKRLVSYSSQTQGRRYRFVRREPPQNEQKKGDYRPNSDRIIPKEVSRHEARDGGGNGWNGTKIRPYPKPQQGAKPPSPNTGKGKCWSCGGNHYSNDPTCPNNKARAPILYHGREVVNDNEEEAQKSSESKQSGSKSSEETSEQFKQIVDDSGAEDEIVDGVQYDSEYTLEECSEYSDYDDDERCYRVSVEDSGEDDTPELDLRNRYNYHIRK
ncbi:hypothetical protein R3P38DRAFT_3368496 [Favolaschia claudopus]|uniref:CCHC-type domain-containing protein n=1 Tax=Favolaschia claudopus TaxID=2862362 RepID=A0AAW0A4Q5_9AGAR